MSKPNTGAGGSGETKPKKELRPFFFPDLGRSIMAETIEEATAIAEKELETK